MMPIWRRIGKYTYKAQRKERNARRRAKIKKIFMLTMQEYESQKMRS
jgi:translation initiation factor IF-3